MCVAVKLASSDNICFFFLFLRHPERVSTPWGGKGVDSVAGFFESSKSGESMQKEKEKTRLDEPRSEQCFSLSLSLPLATESDIHTSLIFSQNHLLQPRPSTSFYISPQFSSSYFFSPPPAALDHQLLTFTGGH